MLMYRVALYWLCYCVRLQCITGYSIRGCRNLLVCEIWTEETLEVSALGCHHCLRSLIKTLHWCPNFKSLGFFFLVNGTNEISANKMIADRKKHFFPFFLAVDISHIISRIIWRIRICTCVLNILHVLKLWRRKSTKPLFSVRHILGIFEWACTLNIKIHWEWGFISWRE